MIPYARQSIDRDDIEAVSEALKADVITRGAQVQLFEEVFAQTVGAQYAVAFSSGSAALNAAFEAGNVCAADRVVTTPNTFIASCAYACSKNARPIFVDIDRNSGNLDLNLIEPALDFRSINGKLFVVPVHYAGIAIDMARLQKMIKTTQAIVIEDAAHALGSLYPDGKKVGSCAYSDMTIFSFHPAKHITTGEGGMVTTNDPALQRSLRQLRNSGIERDGDFLKQGAPAPWYYEVQQLATNSNFTDFQAALGLSQLKKLDQWVAKRRLLVKRYRQNLENIPALRLFSEEYDAKTAYHLMVVQFNWEALETSRTEFMEGLRSEGIGSQYHYIPLYRHPCLKGQMGAIEEYFPEMEAYFRSALSLPLFPALDVEDIDQICQKLKKMIVSCKPGLKL